ncbi:MAG: hypothetical protein AB7V16_06660 [Vulcanibacillus sp.]
MSSAFRNSLRWSLIIFFVTLILAFIITIISTSILAGVSWVMGMLVVFFIVIIGVMFDIIGLAAAVAKEEPFHSMASEKLNGSKEAIRIVRNAARFSNICNDVIGDTCGIISGVATATVVIELVGAFEKESDQYFYYIISVLFTSIVAALTVGGKAVGKFLAINYSTEITLIMGKFFFFTDKNFNISIFKKKTKLKAGGRNGS